MTRDDIIRLAREAGFGDSLDDADSVSIRARGNNGQG